MSQVISLILIIALLMICIITLLVYLLSSAKRELISGWQGLRRHSPPSPPRSK